MIIDGHIPGWGYVWAGNGDKWDHSFDLTEVRIQMCERYTCISALRSPYGHWQDVFA